MNFRTEKSLNPGYFRVWFRGARYVSAVYFFFPLLGGKDWILMEYLCFGYPF